MPPFFAAFFAFFFSFFSFVLSFGLFEVFFGCCPLAIVNLLWPVSAEGTLPQKCRHVRFTSKKHEREQLLAPIGW